MMSIIEQAIQLEKKAEEAYREAAQATSDLSAAKVLAFFADEEAQHAAMLRGMENTAGVAGSNLLQSAQEWIRGAVEGGASAISSDIDLLDVLRQALTIEQQTEPPGEITKGLSVRPTSIGVQSGAPTPPRIHPD